MRPGEACPSCHSFTLAGTVFPTEHEPNDCNGVNGSTAGLTVSVTDAKGKVQTLTVDSAGNFYSSTAFTAPFTAKVVSKTSERDMMAMQTSGNCNSCHTVNGANSAPGRIMAP
jgi:hypothetical protein